MVLAGCCDKLLNMVKLRLQTVMRHVLFFRPAKMLFVTWMASATKSARVTLRLANVGYDDRARFDQ